MINAFSILSDFQKTVGTANVPYVGLNIRTYFNLENKNLTENPQSQ